MSGFLLFFIIKYSNHLFKIFYVRKSFWKLKIFCRTASSTFFECNDLWKSTTFFYLLFLLLNPKSLSHTYKKIYNLYQEYEKKETLEAKIVSALDKLEANLQANQYKDGDVRYWKKCENGEEYYKMALKKKPIVAEINEKIITDLEKTIISLSSENMKRCKVKIKDKKC